MKAFRFTLLLSTALLYNTVNAQRPKTDSIFWENGDVSLLSELGSVFIISKKGSSVKEVRIIDIKKEKGILVYEKEKCLHDFEIGNIKKILPGKHPLSSMHFYADNTPYIKKLYLQMDAMLTYSDFKSLKIIMHSPLERENKPKPSSKLTEDNPEGYSIITGSLFPNTDTAIICDTIIEGNGFITLAKLIEINSRLIRYKKIKNPDGPVYIKSSKDAQITKYDNCFTINYSEK